MVKEFQLLVTHPLLGAFISEIVGSVFIVTEEAKQDYSSIEVTLKGYADVQWTESSSSDNQRSNTYHSHEDYVSQVAIVWDKETAPNRELSPGTYEFPFSLKLQTSGRPLPPSFEGTYGRIRYEIEATIIKASSLKRNQRITAQVTLAPAVDFNDVPDVKLPKMLQVDKTLCCLCCASGPISLTARVPRTGFCVLQDTLSFEADIENGSNRRIKQLVAQLQRQVIYSAMGHHQYDISILAEVCSDPIEAGSILSWKPPPLHVSATELTIACCSIIEVKYFLVIQASISGAIDPHVDFDLFLGNVPLIGVETTTSIQPTPPGKNKNHYVDCKYLLNCFIPFFVVLLCFVCLSVSFVFGINGFNTQNISNRTNRISFQNSQPGTCNFPYMRNRCFIPFSYHWQPTSTHRVSPTTTSGNS